MADGKGSRWNSYKEIPKHLIRINNETLLERTVRLIKKYDDISEIIITSHDARYEVEGATRYEPRNNILEIDRFTQELIEDNICFLYGDTYYSEKNIRTILGTEVKDILFFGDNNSIIAIKIADGNLFRYHVNRVRKLYVEKKIEKCIGWQVYQSFLGLDFSQKVHPGAGFINLSDSHNINEPLDVDKIIGEPY